MFVCQYSLEHTVTPGGKKLGFWMAGSVVFAATVIIANLKILESSYLHSFFSLALIFLSILSYFAVFAVMNLVPGGSATYGIFSTTFKAPMSWYTLIFSALIVFTFD